MEFAEGYKSFVNHKTERECVRAAEALALQAGYRPMEEYSSLSPGDKAYQNFKGKCLLLLDVGTKPLQRGLNIAAAHLDSPRLDVKQMPLYEDGSLAFFKTHYYGGIKKYQWAAIPLSLHGVIYTKTGDKLEISIGDEENEPAFFISDLLVHLAGDQLQKKASGAITGEQLNLIVSSLPLEDSEKSAVKLGALKLLEEMYGIDEKSFLSAELEIVPAGKAKDIGFDRSLLAAYGHDDRSCSYSALKALLDSKGSKERSSIVILCDKEEVGSTGATGLGGLYFENFVAEAIARIGQQGSEGLALRRALANSRVLSMDVTAAYDPSYADAFEKRNTAYFGAGAGLVKYVGSRGKSGSNDANAEYLHMLMELFEREEIAFQCGELGKVDQGGGGTVASLLAKYGADTIDYGVPVLSMHAPYELISKADLYSCYEGAKAFFNAP